MSSDDNDVFEELRTFYTPGDGKFALVGEFCGPISAFFLIFQMEHI